MSVVSMRDPDPGPCIVVVIIIIITSIVGAVPALLMRLDRLGGARDGLRVRPWRPERPADAALGERAEDCVTSPGRRGVCLCVWSMS